MPILTVIMPSYNKEKYIAQALDSVFMQETSYDYQIIVADDCSSDKTIEIVKSYQAKYPQKIILLTSDTNQKLYRNVLRAYAVTKTDYFCVLDPDDFWTDKYKIQKALDFLEKHHEYTIYVTDTLLQLPDGRQKPFLKRKKIIDSVWTDFLHASAATGHTTGSVFRNVVFKHGLPEKMQHLQVPSQEHSFRGDSFRTALHLHEGKAHCVPETDAVYRITSEGIWQGASYLERSLLNANFFKDTWLFFNKENPELLYLSRAVLASVRTMIPLFLLSCQKQKKQQDIFLQLADLNRLYQENKNAINQVKNQIKLSMRHRLQIVFCNTLHYYLHLRGLI